MCQSMIDWVQISLYKDFKMMSLLCLSVSFVVWTLEAFHLNIQKAEMSITDCIVGYFPGTENIYSNERFIIFFFSFFFLFFFFTLKIEFTGFRNLYSSPKDNRSFYRAVWLFAFDQCLFREILLVLKWIYIS